MKDMKGLDMKEGEVMLKFVCPTFRKKIENNFIKALNGEHISVEAKIDYGAKGNIWWGGIFEPVYSKTGEVLGISFNASYVTERKNYEGKVIRQNNILKNIAHIQSLEFRSLVASILGV